MAPSSHLLQRPPPVLPDPSTLPFPGNLIRQCSRCHLRQSCTAPVPGEGPVPARVMLVGEAPGVNEDARGRPFVGQAGRLLDSLLAQAGVPRETAYITNAVRCRPPNNAAPRTESIQLCAMWLDVEMAVVNPDLVVALGASAISRVLGVGLSEVRVEHRHGRPIQARVGGRERVVLPTYHPAAALHNTSLLRPLYDDFRVLEGLARGVDLSRYLVQDEHPHPMYRVADTPALLAQVRDEVRAAGECAVDVETTEHDSRLWSLQVSTAPGTAWFIPLQKGGQDCRFKGGQGSPLERDDRGRIDLTSWGTHVVVHHYLNDIRWLAIPDGGFTDTMVQAYLVGLPQGLKELASRLGGMDMMSYAEVVRPGQCKISTRYLLAVACREWPDPPIVEETRWDNKAGRITTRVRMPQPIVRKARRILSDLAKDTGVDPYERWRAIPEVERVVVEGVLGRMPGSSLADIPLEQAVQYGCRDADATLRAKHRMDDLIQTLELETVLRMDLDILPMVDEMMRAGMAVDVPLLRQLSQRYSQEMEEGAALLGSMVGHPFNPASSKQVAAVVYGEIRDREGGTFAPTRHTSTGLVSTDDEELKKVSHPVITEIIRYRGLLKLKTTYADNLAWSARTDGRVHTQLTTTRVETGRLSSRKTDDGEGANLQNIPTRTREGKAIKSAFVAPPGKVLLEGDLAQIEMVTLAHLSRCRRLIEVFQRGGDPHTEMAALVFGVPLEEAKQERYRYPTKRLNFGIAYLIGAQGLSGQINEYIADLRMEGTPIEIEPWDVPTCEGFIREWYRLNPEVRDYQMEQAALARRYGYVRDMFGRMRYIPEVNCPVEAVREAGLRQAANLPVTASAQGIIKLAMGQMWQELPGTPWGGGRARFLMQIHDSLVVEVDEDEGTWRPFAAWMRERMCRAVRLSVPVRADIKVGRNWGEMVKVMVER